MAMTPRLWGRASSVNVQKVMWALAEIGLEYERIDAGGKYGRAEDLRALNPNVRVPVWQEDGLTLWESHAIVRHLARYGLAHDALADQWMEFTTSTLQPAFIGVFWQAVRLGPEEHSADVMAKQSQALNAALRILDDRLSDAPWLNGRSFSTAEIAAGSLMYRVHDIDWPKDSFPHVSAWYARLTERTPYRVTVMTSYDELRA